MKSLVFSDYIKHTLMVWRIIVRKNAHYSIQTRNYCTKLCQSLNSPQFTAIIVLYTHLYAKFTTYICTYRQHQQQNAKSKYHRIM